MKKLAIVLFLFVAFSQATVFAQYGTLKGLVTDKISKDEIIGAKIFIEETSFRAISDIYGTFKIQDIPKGEYNIKVTYQGYKTFEAKIVIEAQSETVLNVILDENVTEVEGVQVVATRKTNTETAIVLEIKEAKSGSIRYIKRTNFSFNRQNSS
jgi:hypothetical protein